MSEIKVLENIAEVLKSHNETLRNITDSATLLNEKLKFLEQRVYSLENKLLWMMENPGVSPFPGKNRFDL